MTYELLNDTGRVSLCYIPADIKACTISIECTVDPSIKAMYFPLYQFLSGMGYGLKSIEELLNDIT